MFERLRRSSKSRQSNDTNYGDGAAFQRGDGYAGDGTDRPVATDTRDGAATRAGNGYTEGDADTRTAVADRPAATRMAPGGTTATAAPATAAEAREIQRERFGGADGTAIFFGWLSALGLAALVLAVVAAAGTRLGFATGVSTNDATSNASTIGIVGAAILVVILLLAYYCGGYVAGRMARFDGARQGFRVWLLGLLVTIAAAVAGWIGGSQYNVFQQLNLPRIPVKEGDIATGAIITLAVVLVGTLLAAIAGGKAGDRYHARVDAHAWDRDRV
ncbi:MAG TPA: hypothetical protein VH300_09195 [Thermoleophilaceae bacterium]|jgi:hypothetical protein|nr:hypothetical protein [Thermoleophilaceae bacterium]